ncbi:MAG: RNA polymerase sigma factor [Bacteroidetes bacterium]|nr:RNA polymerase sigma factor [Bacteroidota bacterium]MBL7102908.1 RNA polymerase sigma factor [Bacteroidales bacterium]
MKYQSDSLYIDKVLEGDVSAYSMIVDKHKDLVFTVALRIVRNREDAEEIVQDTFLKVYQSLKSFKKESKFSTWLYRIVYNTAISKTRKRQLETTDLEYEIIENYTLDNIKEDVSRLEYDEQKILINKVIEKLSPEESTLINLFYLKEYSTEEISEIMNLSKANVKVKLHRIRKRLYKEVQQIIEYDYKKMYK